MIITNNANKKIKGQYHMKYTSKDIIERALSLADISNTDFLTHKELTQYLNDAWHTVFQWLINKGDSQFIHEVELENGSGVGDWTEYSLPDDLYQIKSIKNKLTGSIVTRHSESQGINSGTYEVVNDKLRLYGVISQPLLLTYYAVPTFITFPDKDILSDLTGTVFSSAGNAVATVVDDTIAIKNIVTGETLGTFSLPEPTFHLGNGHVVFDVSDGEERSIQYWSYDGAVVSEYSVPLNATVSYFLDEEYNVCFQILEDGKYGAPIRGSSFIMNSVLKFDSPFAFALDNLYFSGKVNDSKQYISVYDASEDEFWDDIPLPFNPKWAYRTDDYDTKPAFIISDGTHYWLFIVNEAEHSLDYEDIDIKAMEIICPVRYGLLTSNGTEATLKSVIPNTLMNFPNDLYFSLLACDLALRFAMKMNANTDGLNNLYQNMQTTFMNTLGQDAGYTRIQNVYN